jgi:hypothetical protein
VNDLSKALVFLLVSGSAACAVPTAEDAAGTSDELQTLVPEQIEDVGEFMPNTARTVQYTGQRRYVGIRIHADTGVKIMAAIDIASFNASPVAGIADANLHVLDRFVGGTISGGPGHSFADSQVIAPESGTYWILWGQDQRKPFSLEISYTVKRSAGIACHHDNMCVSESCVAERCEKTKMGTHVGGCIVDSDCTSNSCSSGLCQPILDGGACTASSDCEHLTCESNRCTCLGGGVTADTPVKCCSHRIVGTACTND